MHSFRKLARVCIANELIEQMAYRALPILPEKTIVLHVDNSGTHANTAVYTVYHPSFEKLNNGDEIPFRAVVYKVFPDNSTHCWWEEIEAS